MEKLMKLDNVIAAFDRNEPLPLGVIADAMEEAESADDCQRFLNARSAAAARAGSDDPDAEALELARALVERRPLPLVWHKVLGLA